MTLVRGTVLGLVSCLALTCAPAQAAAPAAAQQVEQRAGGKDWQVVKTWKGGVVRACRGRWDGDSFLILVQLVNRAEQGRRGAVLGARQDGQWGRAEYEPIAPGNRTTILSNDVPRRARTFALRAKVTTAAKKSDWGKVVRLDRLEVC